MEKEVKRGKEENVAQVHMVRSEKQERSDIVYIYIELDGECRGERRWQKGGGTRWDGKRWRTEEGTGDGKRRRG